MSTSAPVKEVHDIPIIRPEEEPRRLNPGVPVPIIMVPVEVPERVQERVRR